MPTSPIRFKCPDCFASLVAPEHLTGGQVRCRCGATVIVPGPGIGERATTIYREPVEVVPVEELPRPARRRGVDEEEDYEERRDEDFGFRCPFCRSKRPPLVRNQIATTGWVLFCVLLIACFPLCILGILIKEQRRVCSSCGIKLD